MTQHTPNNPQAFPKSLDPAITRALESHPQTNVPADFAARVRASLPAQPAPRKAFGFSRATGLVAAAVLTIALFAIAPHATPRFASVAFDLELLMLAELAGIAWWFAARREA